MLKCMMFRRLPYAGRVYNCSWHAKTSDCVKIKNIDVLIIEIVFFLAKRTVQIMPA
jgi:hypothetical protein